MWKFAAGGINLSEGKPTNQSSTSGDAVSSRAVDGNLNPLFSIGQSCSSTTSQANAWWRLDLEEVVYVAHIFIQFRSRCCDSQATHFLIYAGEFCWKNCLFTLSLCFFHFFLWKITAERFYLFKVLTWKITFLCLVRISLITFVAISLWQTFLITKAGMYTVVELSLPDISTSDCGKQII